MKKFKLTKEKGLLIAVPFLFLALYIFIKFNLNDIVNSMPKCSIYSNFGIYCPACGNTRCIVAFLNFDFLAALQRNPFTFSIVILSVLLYIERFLLSFFGKRLKLFPRNKLFFIIGGILIGAFLILRIFFKFLR